MLSILMISVYTSSSYLYDISLMQFSAVTTSTNVMPIQLPTSAVQSLGVNENACDITGWGATTGAIIKQNK